MAGGANAGSLFAGFGKGLSNALLLNRQRDDQKARETYERESGMFSKTFESFMQNVSDDPDIRQSEIDAYMAQFPTLSGAGKTTKKGGSPFADLSRFMGPLLGLRKPRPTMEQQTGEQPRGVTLPQPIGQPSSGVALQTVQPPATDLTDSDAMKMIFNRQSATVPEDRSVSRELPVHQVGVSAPLPVGPEQSAAPAAGAIPPGFPVAAPPVAGPAANTPTTVPGVAPAPTPTAAARPRSTIMGVPVVSANERLDRTIAQQGKVDAATVDRARALLPKLREQMPNATMADALRVVGVNLPASATSTPNTFDEALIASRTDPAAVASLLDLQKKSTEAKRDPKALASDVNTIDEAILVADRAGNQAEVKRLLGMKQQMSAAGREPKAGEAQGDMAIATMVAQNPGMLQSKDMTPSQKGQILSTIANSPQLRRVFEENRMEPIRARTQEVLNTMNQVFKTDAKGNVLLGKDGKPLALSDGAAALYGGSRYGGQALTYLAPGGATATAAAALEQLTGRLALDLITELKASSFTGAHGFGQLNLRELALLESSASVLKGKISEELALEKLQDLYSKYQKIMQPSPQEAIDASRAPGAPGVGGSSTASDSGGPIWKNGKLYYNGVPIN